MPREVLLVLVHSIQPESTGCGVTSVTWVVAPPMPLGVAEAEPFEALSESEVLLVVVLVTRVSVGRFDVAVAVDGLCLRVRFWYDTVPWSFGVAETDTSSFTPPVSDGTSSALMPDSTVSIAPADPPVAVALAGLSVVVASSRSQVPCSVF